MLYIFGDITPAVAGQAIKELDDFGHSEIAISSIGGDVGAGLALFDAIRRHKAKTIAYGSVMSIAFLVFQAGIERLAMPSSLFYVHNVAPVISGVTPTSVKSATWVDIVLKRLVTGRSGMEESAYDQLVMSDEVFDANRAVELNFADGIKGE